MLKGFLSWPSQSKVGSFTHYPPKNILNKKTSARLLAILALTESAKRISVSAPNPTTNVGEGKPRVSRSCHWLTLPKPQGKMHHAGKKNPSPYPPVRPPSAVWNNCLLAICWNKNRIPSLKLTAFAPKNQMVGRCRDSFRGLSLFQGCSVFATRSRQLYPLDQRNKRWVNCWLLRWVLRFFLRRSTSFRMLPYATLNVWCIYDLHTCNIYP